MSEVHLIIACDHAGFPLKEKIVALKKVGSYDLSFHDLGVFSEERVDYPDMADQVAQIIQKNPQTRGVLICGSGQGMAMRANRYPEVRAALCWTPQVAELARAHNDANVLCLGARVMDHELSLQILETFMRTNFEEGRHRLRVQKLSQVIE